MGNKQAAAMKTEEFTSIRNSSISQASIASEISRDLNPIGIRTQDNQQKTRRLNSSDHLRNHINLRRFSDPCK